MSEAFDLVIHSADLALLGHLIAVYSVHEMLFMLSAKSSVVKLQ